MLNPVRRGPAFLSRSFLALPAPLHSSPSLLSRVALPTHRRPFSAPLVKFLHSTSKYGAANATAEAEAEIEEEQVMSDNAKTESRTQLRDGHITKFQELSDHKLVSDVVVNNITRTMQLETMTTVQSLTINETLKGLDVVAQARTGTGKTLAFLIPLVQNIINNDPKLIKVPFLHQPSRVSPKTIPDIRAIIISPTRELAEQIAVEAQKLVGNTGILVQTAVGGIAKSTGLRKIVREGCHILVGTPGRLQDILLDPNSGVKAPNLSSFVLDEADILLDQGFASEIQAIERLLPRRRDVDRQTLMFSATMPQEVMQLVGSIMKPQYKFVQTVRPGEADTHLKVPQKLVEVAGLENCMPALLELCQRELAREDAKMPFKAIVFFGATREATLAKAIFSNLAAGLQKISKHPLIPTVMIEMHAKLPQPVRTRNADTFRRSKSGILFSSDVVSRGMDFPDVTHVIQIGLPSSRDLYIHRVGRTARGDKPGEGWLFLTEREAIEAKRRLRKIPLIPDESLKTAVVDMTKDAELPAETATTLMEVIKATKEVPDQLKADAYISTIGIFTWMSNKQAVLDMMNNRSKYGWGHHTPPAIPGDLAVKLRLIGLTGLNLARGPERSDMFRSGGGGGDGSRLRRNEFGKGRGQGSYGSGRGFNSDRQIESFSYRSRGSRGGDYSGGRRGANSFGGQRAGSPFGDQPRANFVTAKRGRWP